jgi:hypothetical protein
MSPTAPRPSGSRPDGAAGIESGLEHRSITRPQNRKNCFGFAASASSSAALAGPPTCRKSDRCL